MSNKIETITVVLHKETYNKLEEMKQHPRQSFNEIIWDSISELERRKRSE